MSNYSGPDRRNEIKFTREDSDRLVRLETQLTSTLSKMDEMLKHIGTQNGRVSILERRQSWILGIGAAITFIISTVVLFWKG